MRIGKSKNKDLSKKIKYYNPEKVIIEKKLRIPADYQFKAIQSTNYLQSNWHKNKLFVLEQLLVFHNQMSVLDLGTGSGNFELNFAEKVKRIIGVDYNDQALVFLAEKLKEQKIKNVELIQLDIKNISKIQYLPKVDLVLMIDIIEHLKLSQVEKVAKILNRMVKKGGVVCIITPNYEGPWEAIEKFLDVAKLVPRFGGHQHLSKFSKKSLNGLLNKNGFKVEQISTFNLFSFLIPNRIIAEKLCNLELKYGMSFGSLVVGIFKK